VNRTEVLQFLRSNTHLLRSMELLGPEGQSDERKEEKLQEVAGFCAIILRYVRLYLRGTDPVRVLECSCGKSYVGFALSALLAEQAGRAVRLIGVDSNPRLIERCRALAAAVGLDDAEFVCSRTVELQCPGQVDMVVSLHACDTATDEALAKGIQLGARLIMAVPCCQNQLRGQIRSGHPLGGITEFGPARYRLANVLTDALRAQFLRAAGYHVEMDEIGSPKLTPKNLCLCARKVKRRARGRRDEQYRKLRDMFGVRPAIEKLCPGVVGAEAGGRA